MFVSDSDFTRLQSVLEIIDTYMNSVLILGLGKGVLDGGV